MLPLFDGTQLRTLRLPQTQIEVNPGHDVPSLQNNCQSA